MLDPNKTLKAFEDQDNELTRLRDENARLREAGQALSDLLNAGHRYVDSRGGKGPELTALDEALKVSS